MPLLREQSRQTMFLQWNLLHIVLLVGFALLASQAHAAIYTDPDQLPASSYDFVVVGGKRTIYYLHRRAHEIILFSRRGWMRHRFEVD